MSHNDDSNTWFSAGLADDRQDRDEPTMGDEERIMAGQVDVNMTALLVRDSLGG